MTRAAAELSPFAQAAPTLSALGYSCLTLVPPTVTRMRGRGKMPGAVVAGHWQGTDKWERFKDSPLQGFELGLAMKAPGAGVGVVLGTVARPGLFTIGVDVDADDPDTIDAIIRALPASPMQKRGRKGVTLFYAAPKTITSRSFDDHRIPRDAGVPRRLVDILTGFATKQTVCPPSIHPDTGGPYVWLAGPVAASELPLFDEDALAVLEETLQQFGYDPAGARGGRGERKPYVPAEGCDTTGDAFDVAKRAALANIGAWIHGVENLHGLRPARAGFEATSLLRGSSTGQPLAKRKRNLSIQPNGIADFGTGETFSAIDLVSQFNGLSVGEALTWLEDRLGLGVDDSIVIALQPPPENETAPFGFSAKPLGAETGEKVVGATGNDPLPNKVLGETHGGRELPAHLIRGCSGLLGGLAQFICDTARKPQPTLALAAALTILGTAAGRRYSSPTFSGTHLYAVMCGGSGVGKDHPLEMVSRILGAAGMGQHVGPGEFMSFQAAFKAIGRQPLMLCPMDELGAFLGRLSRKGSAGNEAALTGVLRSVWGKSFGTLPVPSWATLDAPTIYVPALSILGASTPSEFFTSLESGAIDNGFLNRWLLFPTYTRPEQRKPRADKFAVPQQIVDGVSAIYNVGGSMSLATMHNGRCDAPLRKVEWEGGDEGPLALEYYRWAGTLDEQSDTESLFARCAEQTIRVATIRAIGSDAEAPVIDRECFEWARELVVWCTEAMISQAGDHMAENQTQADRARVLRAIKNTGTISHRDLTRKLTTFRARELDDIVKVLVDAELVRVSQETHPTNGKRTKRYTFTGDA